MKKIGIVVLMLFSCFVITGCNDLSEPEGIKTEFKLLENASIDHYAITLTKTSMESSYQNKISQNGQFIVLKFQVKNNSKQNDTLKADNFHIIIDNQEYDAYLNTNLALNAKETAEYTIVFDVPVREEYDLLFYSGIVSNNIKFKIEI